MYEGGGRLKTGFIGAGKVGCSLGKYLSIRGMKVTGYYDRNTEYAKEASQFTETKAFESIESILSESDVLFITVPDGLIREVFEEVSAFPIEGKYICHCSGSISSEDAFPGIGSTGAYEYSVHPLLAVSSRFETYQELTDAFFFFLGNPSHLSDMSDYLTRAGIKHQIIDPAAKSRYHLAAVFSSNLVLSLIGEGIGLLQECGFTETDARAALRTLVLGNVQHAVDSGPAAALTGPVERGDIATIQRHLDLLSAEDQQLYRLLSKKLLPLAKAKNPDRDYGSLEEYLEIH